LLGSVRRCHPYGLQQRQRPDPPRASHYIDTLCINPLAFRNISAVKLRATLMACGMAAASSENSLPSSSAATDRPESKAARMSDRDKRTAPDATEYLGGKGDGACIKLPSGKFVPVVLNYSGARVLNHADGKPLNERAINPCGPPMLLSKLTVLALSLYRLCKRRLLASGVIGRPPNVAGCSMSAL
jgi:hypothetical protein